MAIGELAHSAIEIRSIAPAVYGAENILSSLQSEKRLVGISIDAPLIIRNSHGQRTCEREVGKVYGSRKASCHTSNTSLYPHATSVSLSENLERIGFTHLSKDQWQIECYPHPAIIEIFGLPERLKYKKGTIQEKRYGQIQLAHKTKKLVHSSVLRLIIGEDFSHFYDESRILSFSGQSLKDNEDVLDSVLCLYIAGLYALGYEGRTFGNIEPGYIWVPSGRCIE